MRQILVTNDDGVEADGLRALAKTLRTLGDVTVVAPAEEASAVSHALTGRRPLQLREVREAWYSVDGTPTDCVNVAISEVMGRVPDLVVSGINNGLNVGDDVTYSGTVAGALEGVLLGAPALAVSLQRSSGSMDYTAAAQVARQLAASVLDQGLPPRTLLNVNVPRRAHHGIRVPVQARARRTQAFGMHGPSGVEGQSLVDQVRGARLGAGCAVRLRHGPGRLGVGDPVAHRLDEPHGAGRGGDTHRHDPA